MSLDNQFTDEETQISNKIAIDESVKLVSHEFDYIPEVLKKLEEQIYLSFALPQSVFGECKWDNRTSGQNDEITWAKTVDQKLP